MLASMSWTHVAIHDVVSEFLRAERHNYAHIDPALLALIDQPDLAKPQENHHRLRLLYCRRANLLGEIPPDTEWYKVENLTDAELDELYAIARCGWDDPAGADKNELRRVARRRPEPLTKLPTEWPRPILWGHGKGGPFTIMEGNHRLTGYASTIAAPSIEIPILVGLSPTPCYFHIFDPPYIIANDLWK
jgi:hypothetical protein